MMINYILVFMVWIMLILFFFTWKAMRNMELEMQHFYKELNKMPDKLEPTPQTEEPEHELQAENEVNNEVYDKIMEEWMGITLEVEEGDNGRQQ